MMANWFLSTLIIVFFTVFNNSNCSNDAEKGSFFQFNWLSDDDGQQEKKNITVNISTSTLSPCQRKKQQQKSENGSDKGRPVCNCWKTALFSDFLPRDQSCTCYQTLSILLFLLKLYLMSLPAILFTTALYISRQYSHEAPSKEQRGRGKNQRSDRIGRRPQAATAQPVSITRDWKFNKFMLQSCSCACFLFSSLLLLVKEFAFEVVIERMMATEHFTSHKPAIDCLVEIFNDYVCHIPGQLFLILLSFHYFLSLSERCLFVRVPFKYYAITAFLLSVGMKAIFIAKNFISGNWKVAKFGKDHFCSHIFWATLSDSRIMLSILFTFIISNVFFSLFLLVKSLRVTLKLHHHHSTSQRQHSHRPAEAATTTATTTATSLSYSTSSPSSSSSACRKLGTMFIRNLYYIVNSVTFSAFFFYYYISTTVLYVSEQSDDLLKAFSFRIVFQLPLWTYFAEQYFGYLFRRRRFKEEEEEEEKEEEETNAPRIACEEEQQHVVVMAADAVVVDGDSSQLSSATSPCDVMFLPLSHQQQQRRLSCFNVSFVAFAVYLFWLLRRPTRTLRKRHFCLTFFLSFGNLLFVLLLVFLFVVVIRFRNSQQSSSCHL